MAKGICKLCGLERDLLKKSHIIPEFMYERLFDEHHQTHKFEPKSFFSGQSKMQRPSSGEYEGGLLCSECDNKKIGDLESYAAPFLYAKGVLPDHLKADVETHRCDGGVGYSIVRNTDYAKFKLFLLSVLWRSSISKRDFFDQINLEEFEEVIREMLLNNDPKYENIFPIVFFGFVQDDIPDDMINQPTATNLKYGKRFTFPISGFVYNFFTDIEDVSKEMKPHILKSNGEFTILNMNKELFTQFILNHHGVTRYS